MKKLICTAAALFAVLLLFGTQLSRSAGDDIQVRLNGDPVTLSRCPERRHGDADSGLYVPMLSFCEMMGAKTVKWDPDTQTAIGVFRDFAVDAAAGDCYLTANGRCLYIGDSLMALSDDLMVPADVLCRALDARCRFDEGSHTLYVTTGTGRITAGSDFYPEDDLFWLASIIYAEAGAESLTGKIAVGNVVMNRVRCSGFPDTIYDVIFDRNGGVQFEPVLNGTVYNSPTEECYIAAKLAMDGAAPVGECLFFSSVWDCWAAETRPYYMTIGRHYFFL